MAHASKRSPVVFVGHGSPMNAIEDNAWSQGFRALGEQLFAAARPHPAKQPAALCKAILCVSAHWFVPGTYVTANEVPPTIHDFGGFPAELHAMTYPAKGDPALAARVVKLLGGAKIQSELRSDWGLDHGAWTILHHMLPAADVPVVQLGIDLRRAPAEHVAVGRALAELREEGVMILGSGNLTHNLRDAFGRMRIGDATTPPWAEAFDRDAAKALTQHDDEHLAAMLTSDDGRKSHPTPEHFAPILYTAGATDAKDGVAFPITGFDAGSLSMRAVIWG